MTTTASRAHHSCQICGATGATHLRPGRLAGPAVSRFIRTATGSWSDDGWICDADLDQYRRDYVVSLLEAERGELSALDANVRHSLRHQEAVALHPEDTRESTTFGARLADAVAAFGGSWRFILLFVGLLLVWIVINSLALWMRPFDPYPFIFLNLVLSCVAALQAPVIMMSQNRQEARDRRHARHDYQVNLKAELEIRHLHQKLDHLLSHQWERLVEIQQIQMQLINETRSRPHEATAGPTPPPRDLA